MKKLNLLANSLQLLIKLSKGSVSAKALKGVQEMLIDVLSDIKQKKDLIRETSTKIVEKNVEPIRFVTVCELLESKLGIDCIKPFSQDGREVHNNLMTNKKLDTFKIGNARFFKIKSA